MCGRYALTRATAELVTQLDVAADRSAEPVRSVLRTPQRPAAGSADHNVGPAKNVPVVLERVSRPLPVGPPADENSTPVRQLRLMSWGLVPGWAKDPRIGGRMINARAETVLNKPAFRQSALRRRLLVPADGWYEWQVSATAVDGQGRPLRQPFYVRRRDADLLAFAGLYEFWRDPAAIDPQDPLAWLASFTIITTQAEPGLDRVHHRQPVVLERADWDAWLACDHRDPRRVASLLAPHTPGRFDAHPVDRVVGSPAANGPELLRRVPSERLRGAVDPFTGEPLG
ncbi:SOS response-associated protein YedK [Austwickia sp. TVS 96-490-7B]|uniref:SOS response-associated peptidase n=1 Tax=Austwickia sp. TVS 96-490-7B TaxID=2830843 RepID=UPI001C57C016|nr:SOS response-associated peptidase [Austwickia sp. TVS 96-490-7B]MBW3086584.1 SOS response-associated protein YedK [Austwickia sp. TVS 96-490-7B]